MKAFILAAGIGTRLGELTKDTPKCLIKIGNKTILEHQIGLLKKIGINEIVVIIGKDGSCWTENNISRIKEINPEIIINLDNKNTNNTYSLRLALENIEKEDILIIDGDLAFSEELIVGIISEKSTLLLSKKFEKKDEPGNRIELDSGGKIINIGRKIKSDIIYGGLIKIKENDFDFFKDLINKPEYYSLDLGFVLKELCKGIKLSNLISEEWKNINTKKVLEEAENIFPKNFIAIMFGYTGVGKSTIAKKIAKIHGTEIFHSAIVRKDLGLSPKTPKEADKFFDYRNNLRQEVDEKVYGKLVEMAEMALKEGRNVVLDAGYFFRWQRELAYAIAKKSNAELFIINVTCKNEEEIKRRLKERGEKFKDSPLNETPSWNTHIATKMITEPFEKDKLLVEIKGSVVECDTFNENLKFISGYKDSSNSKKIKNGIMSNKYTKPT